MALIGTSHNPAEFDAALGKPLDICNAKTGALSKSAFPILHGRIVGSTFGNAVLSTAYQDASDNDNIN